MNDNTIVWVDPPSGWKYGFPKMYDNQKNPDFFKWMVDNGYPQSIIDRNPDGLDCRMWYPTQEELENVDE